MDYAVLLRQPTVEVTCGNIQGLLHMDCFLCPGIHCPCIEYEGQMISPKKFTILGEKQNLKDWKKAVRIYKSSMRDLMERGFLDFADHDQTCTGKCMSRTPNKFAMDSLAKTEPGSPYIYLPPPMAARPHKSPARKPNTPQRTTIEYVGLPERDSPGLQGGPVISSVVGSQDQVYSNSPSRGESDSDLTPNQLFTNSKSPSLIYVMPNKSSTPSPVVQIKQEPLSPTSSPTEQMEAVPINDSGLQELVHLADKQNTSYKPTTDSVADSVKFWEGIVSLGLIDDFIKEIKISLDILKSRLNRLAGNTEKEAMQLSNVVNDLGLFKLLQKKMVDYQHQTQQQQIKLNAEISLLQKRWSETQKRKSNLVKRQQLIQQVTTSSRLKRPAAVMGNGFHDGSDHGKPKISRILPEATRRAEKSSDDTFIITVNNNDADTEHYNSANGLSPALLEKNDDFLVTITSRKPRPATKIIVDDEDRIFSERQKELEADGETESPELTSPRRSARTRTLSAKGLAYTETEQIAEKLDTDELPESPTKDLVSAPIETNIPAEPKSMDDDSQDTEISSPQTSQDSTPKLPDNSESEQINPSSESQQNSVDVTPTPVQDE